MNLKCCSTNSQQNLVCSLGSSKCQLDTTGFKRQSRAWKSRQIPHTETQKLSERSPEELVRTRLVKQLRILFSLVLSYSIFSVLEIVLVGMHFPAGVFFPALIEYCTRLIHAVLPLIESEFLSVLPQGRRSDMKNPFPPHNGLHHFFHGILLYFRSYSFFGGNCEKRILKLPIYPSRASLHVLGGSLALGENCF